MTTKGPEDTLAAVNRLLDDVVETTARWLNELEALSARASELQATAAADLDELNQWLGLVSMDMGLMTGSVIQPTLDGHNVQMNAMREGVARISLAASRTSVLLRSVTSLRDVIENAVRLFKSDDALTLTLDDTNEHLQTAIAEAREVERRRLASEIHDGPAQVLVNAVNLVNVTEQVAKLHPEQTVDQLQQLREFLKEGVSEVRQFMQDLRPTMLEYYGLVTTLDRYTAQFCARWGLGSLFEHNGELPPLGAGQELATLRILQESLQNIRKHAGPDVSVRVRVDVFPQHISMTITDDGIGFDPLLVAPKVTSGEGILGMRERAGSVHGRLSIESRPGEGSTVTFVLPYDGKPDSSQSRPHNPGQGGIL